jgi:hypothetical protein
LNEVGGLGVVVEGACLVLRNPDSDQVARDVMALGQAMQGPASEELLGDLTLERNAVGSVSRHGPSSSEDPALRSILKARPVRSRGPTPIGGQCCKPFDNKMRTRLTSRAKLVNMRCDLATKIRGLLKTFGVVVGKVGERTYKHRVRELIAGEPGLEPAVHALLAVRDLMDWQIAALETRILAFAKRSDPLPSADDDPRGWGTDSRSPWATIDRPQRFRALVWRGRVFRPDTTPVPVRRGRPRRAHLGSAATA